jgi:3'-phosphoadenosine 5'-phosphosulfate sulfotransferase (PAPS reductase)/FAD synthetase|nr:MAG TPA: phosphoadenosine-phosphosulfate reductase [Caudoviricetes sp.]
MLDEGLIPQNLEIYNSFMTTYKKFEDCNNILCSVSGGSDSDVMVDLFCRFAKDKVTFVFFDTGLEYKATKEHLKYLENKYDIEIVRIRGVKPIPITCRDDGQPFLSKQVSEFISRLQRHNFKWEDRAYDELIKEYPKCSSALKWWCDDKGEGSMFSIRRNKWLKEFMIANPPDFKISNKCCKYSKKDPVKYFMKENDFDLNCYGVRKAEGGVRASAYKNCFTDNSTKDNKIDEYRPIFWYKDDTKKVYEEFFNVIHSKCYTEYGLKRTGCAGCSYGRNFEEELKILKEHEPNLYKAVNNIFGKSYEYTRRYREFCKEMNDNSKN